MGNKLISDVFGWVTLILYVFLITTPLLQKKFGKPADSVKLENKLKVIHQITGVIILFTALIHGKTIADKTGLASGIICFMLLLFITATYLLKKVLKRYWKKIHYYLSVILLGGVIIHITVSIR